MKKILLLFMAAIGLSAGAQGVLPCTSTVVDIADDEDYAYDNGNWYRVGCTENEEAKTVDLRIYNEDLSIQKAITLNYSDLNYDNIYFANCYFNPYEYDVCATKGVFTGDDKWVVILKCWNADDYDEQGNTVCHLRAYDETGKFLGELPGNDMYLSLSKGVTGTPMPYSEKSGYVDGKWVEQLIFYNFTGSGASINAPRVVASRTVAYPNPLPAGQELTISLEQASVGSTTVSFIDMKGQVVDRINVRPGQTEVRVTPRALHHGAYLYTVIYGDGSVASGKLLAE